MAIGAFAFPPAAPALAAIAAVGSAIKFFMKLIPDNRPDPVVVKYKELEKAINEVGKSGKPLDFQLETFSSEKRWMSTLRTCNHF